jgi:hypothetical protein
MGNKIVKAVLKNFAALTLGLLAMCLGLGLFLGFAYCVALLVNAAPTVGDIAMYVMYVAFGVYIVASSWKMGRKFLGLDPWN